MPQSATVTTLKSTDKRLSARRRVLLSGKLVDEAGAFSTDCSIRELSDTGARLRMSAPVPPGDNLYLIELRTGTAHRVRVAWKRDGDLGVHLEREFKLKPQEAFDPSERLRRLWVGASS